MVKFDWTGLNWDNLLSRSVAISVVAYLSVTIAARTIIEKLIKNAKKAAVTIFFWRLEQVGYLRGHRHCGASVGPGPASPNILHMVPSARPLCLSTAPCPGCRPGFPHLFTRHPRHHPGMKPHFSPNSFSIIFEGIPISTFSNLASSIKATMECGR